MKKYTKFNLRRNKYLATSYVKVLGYTCAHPDCVSGKDLEAHHVRPLYKGGLDKFWNLISLCWHCHHTRKLHSMSEEKMAELYVYKTFHELTIIGFEIDEENEEFKEKWKKLIRGKEYENDEDIAKAFDDVADLPDAPVRQPIIDPSITESGFSNGYGERRT